MKNIILLLIIFTTVSCTYKLNRNTPVSIPYSFDTQNKEFNENEGDFQNLKYKDKDLNIMCRFYNGYKDKGNIIEAMIRMEKDDNLVFEDTDISVSSLKHGVLNSTRLKYNSIYARYPTIYYTKAIPVKTLSEAQQAIQNDTITIFVKDVVYKFASSIN